MAYYRGNVLLLDFLLTFAHIFFITVLITIVPPGYLISSHPR